MARHQPIIADQAVKTDAIFVRVHPAMKMEIAKIASEDGLNMAAYLRRLAEEDLRRRGISIVAETRQQIV